MAGRIYAVTGVSTGIGAELAEILMDRGDHVVGFDIAEPNKELHTFVQLDLSDANQISTSLADFDLPLNGLCNNAGLPPRAGLEQKILKVNFLSQRLLTRALLPHLQKGGSVVNMASRAGHRWQASIEQNKQLSEISSQDALAEFIKQNEIDHVRAYDLSKEAMILWTMAETEPMIQRGLRVNSISPGAIATRILDDFAVAFGDRMTKNVVRAGRPGSPKEVAQLAAFLISPDSSWVNGTDVAIDGGMGGFNACDQLQLETFRI